VILAAGLVWFLWTLSRRDNDETDQAWQRFAQRAGLRWQRVHPLLGGQSIVTGVFNEHPIEVYTRTYGKGLVQATRLTATLRRPAPYTLQVRGPFAEHQRQADLVTDDLFSASAAVVIGTGSQFYVRSNRPTLAAQIRQSRWWRGLPALQTLSTFEVQGPHVAFEQLGPIHDADYLASVAELVTELAAVVDRDRFDAA
jgi:hypothetical protein